MNAGIILLIVSAAIVLAGSVSFISSLRGIRKIREAQTALDLMEAEESA